MSHLELDKAFKVIALVRNPTIAQHEWKLNLPPDASLLNPHVANLKSRPLTVLHISDTHWDPDYLEGWLLYFQIQTRCSLFSVGHPIGRSLFTFQVLWLIVEIPCAAD